MTTDLLAVVSGLPPHALIEAVPPACRRDADPAPTPTADGPDVLVDPGPWRPRKPARHLVPAFSVLTSEPYAVRFELAAGRGGTWTPWLGTVTVGGAAFEPLPAAVDGLQADIDFWTAAEPVEQVRLRLRLRAARPDRVLAAPWILTLSASDLAPAAGPAEFGAGQPEQEAPGPGVRLDVPPLSQCAEAPDIAARICSPTSVAMVLAHFGCPVSPAVLAGEVYHPGLDRYGVWPAAVCAAARRGVLGYLLRFPDWTAAAWCLARGRPIVASVRFAAGELAGAPLRQSEGHLVVLTGWDGDHVLVNDPAAPEASTVARRYRLLDLRRVWLERAGVGYVFFRPPAGR